jgi:hypothetical protein
MGRAIRICGDPADRFDSAVGEKSDNLVATPVGDR